MHLVRAIPAQAGVLTEIAHAAKRHWGYPESWILAWRDALTITPSYLEANPAYIAMSRHDALGFCSIVLEGIDAHLDHLWVLPSAMGRGIGRALFAHAEEAAASAGARRLKIEGDPHAAGFYARMGAVPCGLRLARMDDCLRHLPLFEKAIA